MRLSTIVILIVFILSCFIRVLAEENSKIRTGPLFCEQKIPFKIFRQAYVVSASTTGQSNGFAGIGKEWFKEDEDRILYHAEQIEFPGNASNLLIEGEPVSAQWQNCDKKTGLCTFYGMNSNSDGTKFCWKYKNVSIDDSEIHIPKLVSFHANEISDSKSTIGGLECQQLITPKVYKTDKIYPDGRFATEEREDWVNRNFCLPLYTEMDIQSPVGNGHYKIQSVNLSRDFPDSVFTPPDNCPEAQWRAGGAAEEGAIVEELRQSSESEFTEDPCFKRCREMREKCRAQGMDVKADGLGCYKPCQGPDCPYERNCEAVCASK